MNMSNDLTSHPITAHFSIGFMNVTRDTEGMAILSSDSLGHVSMEDIDTYATLGMQLVGRYRTAAGPRTGRHTPSGEALEFEELRRVTFDVSTGLLYMSTDIFTSKGTPEEGSASSDAAPTTANVLAKMNESIIMIEEDADTAEGKHRRLARCPDSFVMDVNTFDVLQGKQSGPYARVGHLDNSCTATVISKNMLLTATHCFIDENGNAPRREVQPGNPCPGGDFAPSRWTKFFMGIAGDYQVQQSPYGTYCIWSYDILAGYVHPGKSPGVKDIAIVGVYRRSPLYTKEKGGKAVGDVVGWMGWATYFGGSLPLTNKVALDTSGYPCTHASDVGGTRPDLCGTYFTPKRFLYENPMPAPFSGRYSIHTKSSVVLEGGQSGSALWDLNNRVRAILSGGIMDEERWCNVVGFDSGICPGGKWKYRCNGEWNYWSLVDSDTAAMIRRHAPWWADNR